jgi:hypothetical protein
LNNTLLKTSTFWFSSPQQSKLSHQPVEKWEVIVHETMKEHNTNANEKFEVGFTSSSLS